MSAVNALLSTPRTAHSGVSGSPAAGCL